MIDRDKNTELAPTERNAERNAREDLVSYCQRMERDGLTFGTGGNLSVRLGEDHILISPRRVPYHLLSAEEVSLVGFEEGETQDGLPASSELPLHRAIYDAHDVKAIVHTHSEYATALSCIVDSLPPIHYLLYKFGGPIQVARYFQPGSDSLATAAVDALGDNVAALLQNHGVVAVGETLNEAYDRARLLEWLATIYWRALSVGEPKVLTPDELRSVIDR